MQRDPNCVIKSFISVLMLLYCLICQVDCKCNLALQTMQTSSKRSKKCPNFVRRHFLTMFVGGYKKVACECHNCFCFSKISGWNFVSNYVTKSIANYNIHTTCIKQLLGHVYAAHGSLSNRVLDIYYITSLTF